MDTGQSHLRYSSPQGLGFPRSSQSGLSPTCPEGASPTESWSRTVFPPRRIAPRLESSVEQSEHQWLLVPSLQDIWHQRSGNWGSPGSGTLGTSVLWLHSDNSTTVVYIRKEGSTRSYISSVLESVSDFNIHDAHQIVPTHWRRDVTADAMSPLSRSSPTEWRISQENRKKNCSPSLGPAW